MKLSKLKERIISKQNYLPEGRRSIRRIRENMQTKAEYASEELDKIKIIGITGSRGKTTTALIVHEYLKGLGKKSILYSSAKIDSPAGYSAPNEACETPLGSENALLRIIEEAESYKAEYLVMEINESAISKGLTEDIPFSVRALTNIIFHHSDELYPSEEYVRIKKSFFKNIPIDEDSSCVFGLTGDLRNEDFMELMGSNNKPKVTFGSKHICEVRGVDHSNIDTLLYELKHDLKGLDFKVRVNGEPKSFKTNILLPHNSLNISCAIAICQALNIFNEKKFNKILSDIVIPGREEVIKVNERIIVLGLFIHPALEIFKAYKKQFQINKVKLLTGAVGHGFYTWNEAFNSERYLNRLSIDRAYDMNYAKDKADYIYLSSCDNGAEDPLKICLELKSYLKNEVGSEIITNRKEAIRKAIFDSKPGDLIFIAGRGNKKIHCSGKKEMELFKDIDVVKEAISELKWLK